MERESLIIYRSFFEAIKELEKEQQAELWNAVFELGFYKKETELTGIAKTVFTLIRPQIEANIRKYENGKRGANRKQNESKTKAKRKQTESKPKANVNVNVNVNENENENTDANASASDFDLFWNQYQKKTGRAKCEAKWNRMVAKEREAALESVAAYVASTPNVTYRKDPLTWLNGKHWEDELSQIQTQKTDAEYKAELEQMGGNAFREKYRLLYEEPLPHTVKDVKERSDLKHMKLYFRISRLFEE